jgi:hypothetical protein
MPGVQRSDPGTIRKSLGTQIHIHIANKKGAPSTNISQEKNNTVLIKTEQSLTQVLDPVPATEEVDGLARAVHDQLVAAPRSWLTARSRDLR